MDFSLIDAMAWTVWLLESGLGVLLLIVGISVGGTLLQWILEQIGDIL